MAKKDKAAPAEEKKEEKVVANGEKPNKPDEKARDAALDELKKQIDDLKEQQNKFKTKIDAAQSGKEEYQQERTLMWDKLKKIDEERKALKDQKMTLLNHFKSEREEKKKVGKMEREANDWNEDKIDSRIREIETKMMTQSLKLKDEKELMVEIKKLKAKRPEAVRKAAELESIKAKNEATALPEGVNLQEQLDSVKEGIEKLNGAHDEQYQQIQDHQKLRDGKLSGSKDLIEKRNEIRDKIQAINQEKDKVWTAWKEASKAFNEWEKEQRKAAQKKRESEWEKQQAEWDAKRAEQELEQPSPYITDVIKLEQAITFCQDLLPKEAGDKKDERDAFFTVAPKGKKNLRKKADKVKSNAIKHSADSLSTFKEVKVAAPVTTAELPAALEQLVAQLDALKVKTTEWEAERKKKIEEAKANKGSEAEAEAPAEAEVA